MGDFTGDFRIPNGLSTMNCTRSPIGSNEVVFSNGLPNVESPQFSTATHQRRRRMSKTRSIDQESLDADVSTIPLSPGMTQRTAFSDGAASLYLDRVPTQPGGEDMPDMPRFLPQVPMASTDGSSTSVLRDILSVRPLTSADQAAETRSSVKKETVVKKISQPMNIAPRFYMGSHEDLTLNPVPVPTLAGSRVRKVSNYFFPESSVIQSNDSSNQTSTSTNNAIQGEKSPKLSVQTIEPPLNLVSPPGSAKSFLFTVKSATSKKPSIGNEADQTRPSTRALSIVSIDEQFQRDDELSLVGDVSETASEFGGKRSSRRNNVIDRRKQFGKGKTNADPIRRSFDSESALRSSTEGGLDQSVKVLSPHFESPLNSGSRAKGNSSESVLLDRLTPHFVIPPIKSSKSSNESSQMAEQMKIQKIVKDEDLKDKLISATHPADFQPENPGDVFQLVLDEKDKKRIVNECDNPKNETQLSPKMNEAEVGANISNTTDSKRIICNEDQNIKKKLQLSKDTKNTAEPAKKSPKEEIKDNPDPSHLAVAREVTKSASSPVESAEKEKTQLENMYMQQLTKARQKTSVGSTSSVAVVDPKAAANGSNVGSKVSTGSNSQLNERPKAAQVNKNKTGKEKTQTEQKEENSTKQKQTKTTTNGTKIANNKPVQSKNPKKASSEESEPAKTVPGNKGAKVAANNQSSSKGPGSTVAPRKQSISSQGNEKDNVVTVRFDGSKPKISNSSSPGSKEDNITSAEKEITKEVTTVSKEPAKVQRPDELPKNVPTTSSNYEKATSTPLIKNALDSISRDAPINSQAAFESELPIMTTPSIPVKKFEVKKTKPDAKLMSTKANTQNNNIKKPPAPKPSTAKGGKKPGGATSGSNKDDSKNSNSDVMANNDVIPNDIKGAEREKTKLDDMYKNSNRSNSVLISGTNWHITVPIDPACESTEPGTKAPIPKSDKNDATKDFASSEASSTETTPSAVASGSGSASSHNSARRLSEEEKLQFYKLLGNTLIQDNQGGDESRSESDTMTQVDEDKFLDDVSDLLASDYVRPLTGDPFREIRPFTTESPDRLLPVGDEEYQNVGRRVSSVSYGSSQKISDDKSIIKKNTDPENEVFNNCGRGVYDIQEESWTSTVNSLKSNLSSESSTHSRNSEVITPHMSREVTNLGDAAGVDGGYYKLAKDGGQTGGLVYWKKGNKLGHGAFGTVWQGLTSTGQLIAVKQISVSFDNDTQAKEEHAKLQEEVNMLKHLKHKNIVKYIGTTIDDQMLNIFMEYIPGGTISGILKTYGRLEENVISSYTWQLINAVIYLHDNNVVHRDIKGSNLMLMSDGTIKLIDFGCAKKMAMNLTMTRSRVLKSMKGTPYWMSPEVIKETGHGPKSDIWSIGCTVFEMATCKPPWADMIPIAALFAIGSNEKPIPCLPLEQYSKEIVSFVCNCMIREEKDRPSASTLLSYDFLSSHRLRRERKASRNSSHHGA